MEDSLKNKEAELKQICKDEEYIKNFLEGYAVGLFDGRLLEKRDIAKRMVNHPWNLSLFRGACAAIGCTKEELENGIEYILRRRNTQ